ncbi:MAG TPA: tRNA (adenosine(37)-N6)-threonylcarbamoyltransferase complex ATPase subunit type 1 TsaE [Verrucomicrobiae bacterium]
MPIIVTRSPAETEALGESWGRSAERGLVIALSGDLGAGKTQLVKGLARGLDFAGRVHSPTFTLVNEYAGGRLTLFHLDLYRLETAEQIHGAGLDEFLRPDGVAVIEWAERWEEIRNPQSAIRGGSRRLRQVRLEVISETERRISYEDFGA